MDAFPIAPDRAALFLDFDGTLVEIAPNPSAVIVPPDLPPLLEGLAGRLGGALAIVSGRPLAQVETLLPVRLAMAGDHGATLRLAPEEPATHLPLPVPPPSWAQRADSLAARFPGALVERKAHGFVVHYRQAPEAETPARVLLAALLEEQEGFVVMPARMAWELKPDAVSKGSAVAAFMARPPFAGRLPLFIGDDVTDEAGMAAARAAGGIGLRLQDAFGTPARCRAWLGRFAALRDAA
jgi:trehalose 6-phosphate phosphatase